MNPQEAQHDPATCPKCGGELTRVQETEKGWVELSYCSQCEGDTGTRVRNLEVDEERADHGSASGRSATH